MTADKISPQKYQTQQTNDNPLADIASKFGGEFWLSTQSKIEKSRQRDKEETKQLPESRSKQKE